MALRDLPSSRCPGRKTSKPAPVIRPANRSEVCTKSRRTFGINTSRPLRASRRVQAAVRGDQLLDKVRIGMQLHCIAPAIANDRSAHRFQVGDVVEIVSMDDEGDYEVAVGCRRFWIYKETVAACAALQEFAS